MDIFQLLRQMILPSPDAGTAGDMRTRAQLNQRDLDPVDPATGQLTPGGQVVPAVAVPPGAPVINQSGNRPLNAQEALQRGDPKLVEALRRRQGLTAVPATAPAQRSGYGAVPARQTSFGDGTSSPVP